MIVRSRVALLLAPFVLGASVTYGQGDGAFDSNPTLEYVSHWAPIGPDGGSIGCLAFHPSRPSDVLCGTNGGGLLRSTNGCASWVPVGRGIVHPYVQCISFSTSTPSNVYAGAAAGVYKSTDGGKSWVAVGGASLGSMGIQSVAVHPVAPLTVYAGSRGHGVFKSLNGGKSWKWVDSAFGYGCVHELVIDSSNPSIIHACVSESDPAGVFKSVDGGKTWSHLGLTREWISDLVVDPRSSNTLFAADANLWRTTDGGANWSQIAQDLPNVRSVAVDPHTPAIVYAGTLEGVYRSPDGGDTWAVAGTQVKNLCVDILGLSPSRPSTICAGTAGDGVFLSTDGAASWAKANKGLCARQTWALAFDGSSAGSFYAGGRFWLSKSVKGGSSWKTLELPSAYSDVSGIAVHPGEPGTAYVSVPVYGVRKTTDGGATWQTVGLAGRALGPIILDPRHPATVLVGTFGNGIMRSRDGGRVWAQAGLGKVSEITCLALDPVSPGRLFVGTSDGVWKGTVDGSKWSRAGLPDFDINCLATSSAGNLYAGTSGGGLRRSDDGGSTWTDANTGLVGGCISAIAIDPGNPSNLSVAVVQSGIYRSTNGAASWTPMNEGIPPMLSTCVLMFDPKDRATLYAGTEGGGIYRIKPPSLE